MLQNIKIFSCCSSYKQLLLQNISAFNIRSGERYLVLLANNYISFEQLGPEVESDQTVDPTGSLISIL